MIIFENKIQ